MDLEARAQLSEWMDEPCSYEQFRACLLDLAQVNRITFAYRPTLQWLRTVVSDRSAPLHLLDVGCGGGDTLRIVEQWAKRERVNIRLTGLDLNPYAAQAARQFTSDSSLIEWVTGDAFSYQPAAPIDYVISSLFTHHLPNAEIVRFLQWMEQVAVRGWFVNDLHRERLPYYGFQLLARALRWHPFIQHDGPVSIRRAFRHDDWQAYLTRAGLALTEVELETFRPARLCVSRIKGPTRLQR